MRRIANIIVGHVPALATRQALHPLVLDEAVRRLNNRKQYLAVPLLHLDMPLKSLLQLTQPSLHRQALLQSTATIGLPAKHQLQEAQALWLSKVAYLGQGQLTQQRPHSGRGGRAAVGAVW